MSKNKQANKVVEEKLTKIAQGEPIPVGAPMAMSREEALNQFLAAKATIVRLEAENVTLKERLQAIIDKVSQLILTLDFPTKITFWWAVGNASKLITFVKEVIAIIKSK